MNSNFKALFGTCAVVAALALTSCASSHKKEDEAAKAPPTPAQQQAQQQIGDRAQYVQQTQARMSQLDQFSNQLRNKANVTPPPQKKKISNAADDMETALMDVKKSLNEVNSAPPQDWLDYKRDVEKSMQRAEAQYTNTVSLLQ